MDLVLLTDLGHDVMLQLWAKTACDVTETTPVNYSGSGTRITVQ